ncbi:MAG: FumA C-terminus/TtdB family hydratase beta subunit [Nanoarchaeota archaeon]|nr:FumA C-terminus/TtdB family hydratase beta subunit [Nanoarchaeota archaeon]
MIKLTTPLHKDDINNLKVGDSVLLSGTIFTARDAVHKYLLENPQELPKGIDLTGAVIFHAGPNAKKVNDKWVITAIGPTTSARMSAYEPDFIKRFGVRAIIGKGGMDKNTKESLKNNGAAYFSAIGGAAALLAQSVVQVKNVFFLERFAMTEAMWELEVKDFPVIVTMDRHGKSVHDDVKKKSGKEYERLIGE